MNRAGSDRTNAIHHFNELFCRPPTSTRRMYSKHQTSIYSFSPAFLATLSPFVQFEAPLNQRISALGPIDPLPSTQLQPFHKENPYARPTSPSPSMPSFAACFRSISQANRTVRRMQTQVRNIGAILVSDVSAIAHFNQNKERNCVAADNNQY